MRSKGWITVQDNDIWREVSADLSFSGVLRKHAADATRLLAGNAVAPPKKAAAVKKSKKDATDTAQLDALKEEGRWTEETY